jgi:hypothetical protein
MPAYDRSFQLGLLPEKKWNWRTFATSYGIVTALVLLLIFFGIIMPDTLLIAPIYRITELIPRPALRPERLPKPKPPFACQAIAAGSGVSNAQTGRATRNSRSQTAAGRDGATQSNNQ